MNIENGSNKEKRANEVGEAYAKYLDSGDIRPFFETFHKRVLREYGFIGRLIQPVATWVSMKAYEFDKRREEKYG